MYAGKTALITGANAGLGLEFAHQFAASGCALVLVARRAEKLEEVATEIREKHGVEVHVLVGDLSQPDCPAKLLSATEEQGLSIDILVNNAGASGPHLLNNTWEKNAPYLELMMISVAHMCHRFTPGMVERGYGRVINVASVAGRITRPAGGNYGPAKAYVIAMTEELALLLDGTGVQVSALCPGFTRTDFHEVGEIDMGGLPGFAWYDADVVVREGISAVERGRTVQISGRLYRVFDPLLRSSLLGPLMKFLGL